MKKYTVTLNEHQLALISMCLEDIHRFLCGDTELYHTTSVLGSKAREAREMLAGLREAVAPELPRGASYDWAGNGCPDRERRRMIAETYYLYREMRHQINLANGIDNVYTSETLRCRDSGEEIRIKTEKR